MKRLLCIFALMVTAMSTSDLEAVLKKSNDQFSANMLQEVVKSQGDQSCVLSAFSVLSPLAQLALASKGASHDEILRAIGFPNDNVTKLVFSHMYASLRSVKGVDLELASKIYIGDDYSLNDKFAALSKKIFHSEIENIDFTQNTEAAAEINAWVEDHTNKRIKNLVDPNALNGATTAILVNAIYFKGNWTKQFDKYLTKNRDFHVNKHLTKSLSMMYQSNYFRYADSEEFNAQFLEMEYEGSETSFVVALPNEIEGINNLIQKMKDPLTLNKALNDMSLSEVRVFLPKFKIETTTDLVDVLEKMNIKKLFQPRNAKLINLLQNVKDFSISGAIQKAFIEVKEEGAEAAAANAFIVGITGTAPIYYGEIPVFKADHPFLFFVMERNNILFSGVYRS